MSVRPTGATRNMRCPRCQNPFKMPLDRLGNRIRCKSCDCQFVVVKGQGSKLEIRLLDEKNGEGTATGDYVPAQPKLQVDRHLNGGHDFPGPSFPAAGNDPTPAISTIIRWTVLAVVLLVGAGIGVYFLYLR